MKITNVKNVGGINMRILGGVFLICTLALFPFLTFFKQVNGISLHGKLPKATSSINTYGIINNGVTLKDKEECVKRVHKHINIYEQMNKNRRIFFLPLIIGEKGERRKERVEVEIGKEEENETKKEESQFKEQKDVPEQVPMSNKDADIQIDHDQTTFEYSGNNLYYIHNKMENVCEYLHKCDYVIIPIDYNDILNKHLLDIPSFQNFINAVNTLFYLEQKRKKYEVIMFVYNYKENEEEERKREREKERDDIIPKEKAQIAKWIRTFFKNQWKYNYDNYFTLHFLFQKSNVLDFDKIDQTLVTVRKKNQERKQEKEKDMEKEMETDKAKENEKEKNKLEKKESQTVDHLKKAFPKNYKPDILKKLNTESYFLYNFFASYKIGLLKEYLDLTREMKINDFDKDIKTISVKKLSTNIENVLNQFLDLKLSDKITDKKNAEKIKQKQYLYLLHIILTDIIEKYEFNLEAINKKLYTLFKANIRKIKITHNLIMDFQREINKIDELLKFYNSKISFSQFLKKKDINMERKASYIYYYNKMKLLQLLHETSNEIINYYISKGLFVKNFNFDFNFFTYRNKYSFINYLIYYIGTLLKNRLNLSFNYLSPNAFGLSSYKDDISLLPKKDLMITTSEIDQIEKINIPRSEYSKILLLLTKNKT